MATPGRRARRALVGFLGNAGHAIQRVTSALFTLVPRGVKRVGRRARSKVQGFLRRARSTAENVARAFFALVPLPTWLVTTLILAALVSFALGVLEDATGWQASYLVNLTSAVTAGSVGTIVLVAVMERARRSSAAGVWRSVHYILHRALAAALEGLYGALDEASVDSQFLFGIVPSDPERADRALARMEWTAAGLQDSRLLKAAVDSAHETIDNTVTGLRDSPLRDQLIPPLLEARSALSLDWLYRDIESDNFRGTMPHLARYGDLKYHVFYPIARLRSVLALLPAPPPPYNRLLATSRVQEGP